MASIQDLIQEQVHKHPIVLYMKGNPRMPQCGFSARAVQLLQQAGATEVFTVDVLADPQIRDGIKQYSNWPTIPQLYIGGEFIGGSDIMADLYQQGELQKLVANVQKQQDA
ncbi:MULTISPECIES: Grx4 family monothiol glutaredoxin [Acidithiobacillus]|jgi:monothiol glutaredoxin|uniref:Glutaredoxin n=3 Tax=Acidithiobacillus caldus TaxID=33059 RepID=F9ZTF3_ACICS|nr:MULTISPECIES: Grx4 family monothiol glutaredoxin [Acidithiobacillus]AEK57009.1 Glutaredoxin-like protein [Acidithiobacillus caldus SM-1]AIA54275.1 Glutaredoxin-related protein [Acidithiobacillus caldus ATCC 51756]AUW31801.1 Grx4 family monothiol glutaredoxin [Acidithiobacillus caldus]MBU2730184.1 Grx4 family monothiol glutaredoxin [Acidithiobacillus caldus]MBU2734647.1 Grx4 family monothiol glutaredoxin [Acidithiobacillus caldus ATCC 51756]